MKSKQKDIKQKDIVEAIALRTLLPVATIKTVLDSFHEVVESHLRDDETISLHNFGRYETISNQKSRIVTKGKVEMENGDGTTLKVIKPNKKIVFTPGKQLLDRISRES